MNQPVRGFIPAAGYGERLLPITRALPKPLLPILGVTALERVMGALVKADILEIGVNTHHLAEQVEARVRRSRLARHMRIFRETTLLGTGGALRNAADFLGAGPFLVHNGDVLSELDLKLLLRHHEASENLATLAVRDDPVYNRLLLDGNGHLLGLAADGKVSGAVAFTGIAVYEPSFLEYLPAGVSHVVSAWGDAVSDGRRIGTLDVSGIYWSDLGTPDTYAGAVRDMLARDGEYIFIHPDSKGCEQVSLEGHVVVEEGVTLGKGAVLRDVILLPGASIAEGRFVSEIIGGPGFERELDSFGPPEGSVKPDAPPWDRAAALLSGEVTTLKEIGYGGSVRQYYRAESESGTRVLACSDPGDPDFIRHLRYTEFLTRNGIRVPELLCADTDQGMAVFEDLGDVSLYSWMRCPRGRSEIAVLYRRVLRLMAALHELSPVTQAGAWAEEFRMFDREHFRWESRYFLEEFVMRHKGLEPENPGALSEEMDCLAARAASFSVCIVHRDFQSQNVMLIGLEEPALIDYQSARLGPPAYDLASFLWDPYSPLDPEMRTGLLDEYLRFREGSGSFDREAFFESLPVCRIQRHMQALGAYAFLSSVRKKRRFLRFIGPALDLLAEDLRDVPGPQLERLVMKIRRGL